MTTFALKLIIAITPLLLLVGSTALLSSRCQSHTRRLAKRRRTCRSMQKALAHGVMVR